MKYWKDHFSTGYRDSTGALNVSASQTSEIVSILSAGTFFGALLSAPLADWMGRRLAMIFDAGVFTFGVILQTASTAIPMFVAGRFFAGLGVGLLSATIPLYQSEGKSSSEPVLVQPVNTETWFSRYRSRVLTSYQYPRNGYAEVLSAAINGLSLLVYSWLPSSSTPPKTGTTQAPIGFPSLSNSPGPS